MVIPDDGFCGQTMLCINNIDLNRCVVIDGYIRSYSIHLIFYVLAESNFEPKAPKQINVTYEI
jgi:hypothetical protein